MTKTSRKNLKTISQQDYDKIAGARVSLLILKLVAVWPWKSNQESRVELVQRWVIHVPFSLIFCLLVWVEAFISPDLGRAGNVLYMSLTLTVNIVKLLNIRVLSKEAISFINELEHNKLYNLITPQEADIWTKHQKSFRNVVLIYTCGSVFSCIFAFVGVLFDNEYRLGFSYWVPFDWRNPKMYWYAYSFNIAAITVSCFTSINLDLLGCYMIFHIGLLYKILGMRYSNIRHLKDADAVCQFRKLFLMHSSIKRRTQECEVLISHFVLALIIFSALIICFCGYRLKNMHIFAELSQFLSMLQFLSIIVLEIYLPCHFATQLETNSANLLFKIYDCNWLQYSVSSQKFLCLYMEFFKKPERIRAGRYFEIGLPIFKKVMNNAYSFFALLLNMEN